ncbi:MAG TPA: hypothetical protein VLT81_04255 [Chondromyces sp.]|nr:hypothetical protein [Chondromyces sp.]
MRRNLMVLGLVLSAAAGAALAVDVPLRDGTVIGADSYTVNGSYVVLKLPNGSSVAYDVGDVDIEALRAAEAAAAAGEPESPEPTGPSGEAISAGRSLKSAAEAGADEGAALAITDRDVKHVRGSGVRGDEEQAEAETAPAGGATEGFREGGGVVLDGIRVEAAGEGSWRISGQVINRNPFPVINVSVKLEASGGVGVEPWSGEMLVASALGPDAKAAFEHSFAAEVEEGRPLPKVRASVIWMQEETRREPDYTGAGGVPHPSNLPFDVGGVGGADVRPTPVQ